MLPPEEEKEFQTLLAVFKNEPALQDELMRVSYEDLFSNTFLLSFA